MQPDLIVWGIPTETTIQILSGSVPVFRPRRRRLKHKLVEYYFTIGRCLGAHKLYTSSGSPTTNRVLRLGAECGVPSMSSLDCKTAAISMTLVLASIRRFRQSSLRKEADGIWESDPALYAFADLEGKPYMYRITNEQGVVRYRTDLYSREQIGIEAGTIQMARPTMEAFNKFDGTVSCSVVRDPDVANSPPNAGLHRLESLNRIFGPANFQASGSRSRPKWKNWSSMRLHIGSLGFGKAGPGDLDDAMAFLDHLTLFGCQCCSNCFQCLSSMGPLRGDTVIAITMPSSRLREDGMSTGCSCANAISRGHRRHPGCRIQPFR